MYLFSLIIATSFDKNSEYINNTTEYSRNLHEFGMSNQENEGFMNVLSKEWDNIEMDQIFNELSLKFDRNEEYQKTLATFELENFFKFDYDNPLNNKYKNVDILQKTYDYWIFKTICPQIKIFLGSFLDGNHSMLNLSSLYTEKKPKNNPVSLKTANIAIKKYSDNNWDINNVFIINCKKIIELINNVINPCDFYIIPEKNNIDYCSHLFIDTFCKYSILNPIISKTLNIFEGLELVQNKYSVVQDFLDFENDIFPEIHSSCYRSSKYLIYLRVFLKQCQSESLKFKIVDLFNYKFAENIFKNIFENENFSTSILKETLKCILACNSFMSFCGINEYSQPKIIIDTICRELKSSYEFSTFHLESLQAKIRLESLKKNVVYKKALIVHITHILLKYNKENYIGLPSLFELHNSKIFLLCELLITCLYDIPDCEFVSVFSGFGITSNIDFIILKDQDFMFHKKGRSK